MYSNKHNALELQTTNKVKCVLTDICHEKDSKKEAKLKKRHISNTISDFIKVSL